MKLLNVRCCCNGLKILGTLLVPDHALFNGEFRTEVFHKLPVTATQVKAITESIKRTDVSIKIMKFRDAEGREELAVYSDDRSVEYWRDIQGFTENV